MVIGLALAFLGLAWSPALARADVTGLGSLADKGHARIEPVAGNDLTPAARRT
jgi:hypothetical protein